MKYAWSERHIAGLIAALLLVCSAVILAPSTQNMQNPEETVPVASAKAVELAAQPVRVKLVSGNSGDGILQSLPASRSVYVVLSGLSATKPPGTLFHLYLDLPEDVAPKPDNAWHIGSINFYNAAVGPDALKDKADLPITLDITDVVRKLRAGQKLTAASTITVTATRTPEADSKPVIGQIALVVK
jgi:hypothetical protein